MSIRRAHFAASGAAALAGTQEFSDCNASFLTRPVECAIERQQQQMSDDPPVVECRVTFLIGPVMCCAERTISEVTDPGDT